MKLYWEALLRLIYPAACGVCTTLLELEEQGICSACRHRLAVLRFSSHDRILRHRLPSVDEGWTLYPYESPVKEILLGIKFSRKRWLVHVFEEEIRTLALAMAGETAYDFVIPIPLDRQKLIEREFNQSDLIADTVARNIKIPLEKTLLRKRWNTSSQSILSRRERQANLKNAFKVVDQKKIQGKSLLLVDDVLTTGATAEEASQMLKRHGAKRVDLFTLARTEVKS